MTTLLNRSKKIAAHTYSWVLAGLLVLLLSFLFPNQITFKYEYAKGDTWRYGDLKAPFDFAIKKTEVEIENELRQSGIESHDIYELNQDQYLHTMDFINSIIFSEQLQAFNDIDINQNIEGIRNVALVSIDELYNTGVTSSTISELPSKIGIKSDTEIKITNTNELNTVQDFNLILQDKLGPLGSKLTYISEVLSDHIKPNLSFNEELTSIENEKARSKITLSKGMIEKGTTVIHKDDIITSEKYQKLKSMEEKDVYESNKKKSDFLMRIGYFILTSLIIGILMFYLYMNAPQVIQDVRQSTFIFFWIAVFSYLVFWIEKSHIISVYAIPFCIAPIVIRNFYNDRIALFVHIVIILIASFLSSVGYEFTFMMILAGIVSVLSKVQVRYISKFFVSILLILGTYLLTNLGMEIIQEGDWKAIDLNSFSWLILSAFLTLLAYPLIPLLERLFGYTSELSLVELADMDKPLLKEMSIKTPGTFQHSLQVANLSEAAASSIGANALLCKVAALYHDIGKMAKPNYFIENQSGTNPHDAISDLESAKIIISHVTEGIKMAKKNGLPKIITRFIESHHGSTRVEWFYRNHVNNNPDITVDEADFTYPGPKPVTKEETILMIADSIEAASKSLKNPDEQSINDIVTKITNHKISLGQLSDSELTFDELEKCMEVFKSMLKSIHHVRIEYPDEKK